jgi:peptidoglycan biosynthesis protein MviN/MurJ (putative lipid II flippase)
MRRHKKRLSSYRQEKLNFRHVVKWKYSPTLFLAAVNTFCSVLFQLGILWKLGVGARSDLYYASIVTSMVLYTLLFGALNCVLIPMFVETRARGHQEQTLLWNGVILVLGAGALLSVLSYYPIKYLFPLMFRKLAWIDLGQVEGVLLAYSAYQTLFSALAVKNCFLLAQGSHVKMQIGVFSGWVVSLSLLALVNPIGHLWLVPLCLVFGNAVGLAWPNLPSEAFFYQRGLFKSHGLSLAYRISPVAIGGSVTKLEPVIDGVIASFFKEGSLTVFYFFGRILFYISTVTFSGYLQPEQKRLAEAVSQQRWTALRRGTRMVCTRTVLISLVFLACIVCGFAILSFSGLNLAKPYISYFARDIMVLFLLSGYLIGLLIGVAYSNSLYALRQEKLFLYVTLVVFPAAFGLKLGGAHFFGLNGLAAGTSIYWLLYSATLVGAFTKDVVRRERSRTMQRQPIIMQSAEQQ